MDQRQIQRLEVLQMSAAEMRDYLQELSQENPVVDLNEPDTPTDPEPVDRQLQHLRWLADNDHQNQYYQALDEYEDDPIARIGVSNGLEETLPQLLVGRWIASVWTVERPRPSAFCLCVWIRMDISTWIWMSWPRTRECRREKYLQCHRGVYPLSWFFSRKAAGEDMGGAAARAMLRELIDGEDKACPLSDQKLCEGMLTWAVPFPGAPWPSIEMN